MILDRYAMTVSHEEQVWKPSRREWQMVSCMSAHPQRVWERDVLMRQVDFLSLEPRSVDTAVRRIRRAFRERGWPDPIETRAGLGYVWTRPMSAPPPNAEAHELRSDRTQA